MKSDKQMMGYGLLHDISAYFLIIKRGLEDLEICIDEDKATDVKTLSSDLDPFIKRFDKIKNSYIR